MLVSRHCFLAAILVASAHCVRFNFRNANHEPLWIGILGEKSNENLRNGGFIMKPREYVSVDAPDNWGGKFWARTNCDATTKHCLTGDCGNKVECAGDSGYPPATAVEVQLNASGNDIYTVSLFDGFNIKVSIEPIGGVGGDGTRYSCQKSECSAPIKERCPDELKLFAADGVKVIGCKSACEAFGTDELCCLGAFNSFRTCTSNSHDKFFKKQCPDARSYAFDYKTSIFTCKAPQFLIVFG